MAVCKSPSEMNCLAWDQMDNGGNKVRWSRLPNCSFFIHYSGNQFKVECVHQRQTDWNKRRRSWLGPMWYCATVSAWTDRMWEDILAICLLSFCSPVPMLFQWDPREAEVCQQWFLVLESLTELLLPWPEAKVSIFLCSFRIFAVCPQGSLQAPAVLSGVGSEPVAGEAPVPLVPRLADSSWLAARREWLALGIAMPQSGLPLHESFPFLLLQQESWVPKVISSLPALTRNWWLYFTEQISMEWLMPMNLKPSPLQGLVSLNIEVCS